MAKRIQQMTAKGSATAGPDGWTEVSSTFALAKEGDTLEGIYLGPGAVKTMKPRAGQKKGHDVPTYQVVEDTGVVHDVLGSAQLTAFFEGLTPKKTRVHITRGGQVDTQAGNRVTTFRLKHRPV